MRNSENTGETDNKTKIFFKKARDKEINREKESESKKKIIMKS